MKKMNKKAKPVAKAKKPLTLLDEIAAGIPEYSGIVPGSLQFCCWIPAERFEEGLRTLGLLPKDAFIEKVKMRGDGLTAWLVISRMAAGLFNETATVRVPLNELGKALYPDEPALKGRNASLSWIETEDQKALRRPVGFVLSFRVSGREADGSRPFGSHASADDMDDGIPF